MNIRTEIRGITASIQSALPSYTGGDTIQLNEIETKIVDFNQMLLTKLVEYENEEKSLKGRIETLMDLKQTLNAIQGKRSNVQEQGLLSVAQKVGELLFITKFKQLEMESQVSSELQKTIIEYNNLRPYFLKDKITAAAFRTLKDVAPNEESLLDGIGSLHRYTFWGLKNDLEQFSSFYKETLTDTQQDWIAEISSQLELGSQLHAAILNLFYLQMSERTPDEYIESQIADLSYDIQESINKLEIGQSILIPGGCTGHAVVYQMQRVREDEFEFSIYNTGLGNEFGQLFFDNISSNQFRIPLFRGLSKDAVTDYDFISDLIRYKVKVFYNMNDVHKTIINHLKIKNSAKQTLREPHNSQTWGTCSYDSVLSFLEYTLPPSLFKPFEYDTMLRARSDLNRLLPNGTEVFSNATLRYIDKKSCESLANLKLEFDKACFPFEKDELTISYMLNVQKMKSQEELKNILELWSDHDVEFIEKSGLFHSIALKFHSPCNEGKTLLHPMRSFAGYFTPECYLQNYIGPLKLMLLLPAMVLDGGIVEEPPEFFERRLVLAKIQELIDRESPEASKILRSRNQELGSGNKPVLGKELDLNGVFNYLKMISNEILMCVPPLLDLSLAPLKDAVAGCSNLPEQLLSHRQHELLMKF